MGITCWVGYGQSSGDPDIPIRFNEKVRFRARDRRHSALCSTDVTPRVPAPPKIWSRYCPNADYCWRAYTTKPKVMEWLVHGKWGEQNFYQQYFIAVRTSRAAT